MLKYLLICCLFFSVLAIKAQTVFKGRVLENKTHITLHGVKIKNLNNNITGLSDNEGNFGISAKVGDVVVFNTFAYQPDTVLVTDMHEKEIFMEPVKNMLSPVTITDSSGRAKANDNAVQKYDPEYHGQTVVYQRDGRGYYKGGIAIRLHYWKRDDHKKKKAAELVKERETSEEISRIFVPDNISKYVPLKGEDMDNFILLYIPEVDTYTNPNFNMLTYLNTCYKEWQTLTKEQQKSAQIFGKQ
jgi:hypothetical protein